MKFVCLDMEGVLTPEIWQHVARRSGIEGLKLTTREVKDYRELMDRRVEICGGAGLTLEKIQGYIAELQVFEGARECLDWIRERYQLVVLSDTFYEFAGPFQRQLGHPTLLCNGIAYDAARGRLAYTLRQEDSKAQAVRALQSMRFRTCAAGDSYNDVRMLQQADTAALFRAPASIQAEYPQFPNLQTYDELKEFIAKNL